MDRDPLVKLPPALAPFGSEPSARQAHYLLGIDGGATKTLAAVLDVKRGALHVGHGGPSNQDAVGVQAAGRGLFEAADEALAAAGIEDAQLDAAVLAVAGTDTDAVEAHVRGERSREWIVVGDVVGAWATATGARPGVGAIAGTGSNVFGVGPDGRAWRGGRLGSPAGRRGLWVLARSAVDQGGAARPRALRPGDAAERGGGRVLRRLHRRGDGDAGLQRAADQGPRSRRSRAGRRRSPSRATRWRANCTSAGRAELAQQIAAVIHQTGLQGDFPVGLIGSACKAGAVFVDPLTRAIHATAPEAQVAVVEMTPVGGSLLLAARAGGGGGAGERRSGRDRPSRRSSRGRWPRGAQGGASRASTARRSPIAPGPDPGEAHGGGGVGEARRPAGGRPSRSATKKAAANTSPAPRSSRGAATGGTGRAHGSPPGSSSVDRAGRRR